MSIVADCQFRLALAAAACLMALGAEAASMTLLATLGDRAVFLMEGERRTLKVGESAGDFKLVAVSEEGAVIETGGQRSRIALGQGYVASRSAAGDSAGGRMILTPDEQGHYYGKISVNGHAERGVIDTGASTFSMPRTTANAMDIPYTLGREAQSSTANGMVRVWVVKVPKVQLGTITLYDVTATVRDVRGGPVLIGNSVLDRFHMSRDQGMLTLTKKTF